MIHWVLHSGAWVSCRIGRDLPAHFAVGPSGGGGLCEQRATPRPGAGGVGGGALGRQRDDAVLTVFVFVL